MSQFKWWFCEGKKYHMTQMPDQQELLMSATTPSKPPSIFTN